MFMSAFVSKEVLVDYAAKELDRSRKNKPFVRSEVINLALKFVELITFDNAPTPQAGIDEDGNVEIEYLVDGHDLNLTVFSEDLALLIYASDAKGKIAFEYS
jgi:hypothetical protein